MAFKVINNEVITDSSVLQNTTIDESNVLNNVFNVTDGTTSHQVNRGDTVTFTAGAGVTITQLNGTVTISSDAEGIEDLISPLLVHSNHTYIDATYDDINDQVLLAVNITTDGVAEGTTNLYYTDARADARIALQTGIYLDLSGKDTDDLVQGSTNLYYADSLARAAISASGDLSYNNLTGVISYSTPTNVSTFTNDAGYLTSYTDTNTTYSISSETGTGGANIRLTGSDTSTDNVLIAGGTNVTVARTDANTITISSTDTNTTYSAGTGLSLVGTTFNNTAPDQTVTLTGSGATSITGTYPNFTISSTDNNTTYSAGSGVDLTGTTFSHSDTSSQASLTALVGADVVSDIDVDGFGHVTALATRTMTLNDLGFTGATNADYYYGWNLHVGGIDRGDVLSSETIDFVAGGGIDLTYSTTNDNTITIAHTDTSAAANLTASSRRYVTGLTFDTYGHVTGYTTGTETVTDTNNYVSSLSFNTSDGVLTANRSGLAAVTVDLDGRYLLSSDYVDNDTYTSSAAFNTGNGVITFTRNDATTYTVDIDGRYLQSYTETQTLQDVTDLGATTTNAISITNTTSSTSPTTGALKVSGGVGIAENLYIGGDTNIAGDTVIDGNLTVNGTTTTVDVASLSISDNLIYLNNGGTATITNVVGNGSTVTYTADNNFSAGYTVDVTGVNPTAYNVSGATITSANATSFTISSTATGTYVSGGTARAHTNTNVDLGWAGSYNDGSYAHAGIFRDATDGRFKIFDGYTPEPDDAVDIDTTHASFSLADMQAATFIGALTGNASTATSAGKWTTARTITLGGDLTGNVSIDGSANVTLTATVAANSVALGTDTTGNYAGSITAGGGITVTGTAGEGTAYTVAHTDTSTAANLSATSRTYVNSLTFDTYGHVTGYGTATETVTDTDTTYSISSETGTGGANLRLTGSDLSTDNVLIAGGTNVTVTRTDANTITISSTDTNTTYSAGAGLTLAGTTFSHTDTSSATNLTASGRTYVTGLTFDTYGHVTGYSTGTETVVNTDTNTTYDISSVTTTGGALLRLTAGGSGSGTDDVKFASGTNVSVAYTDANTITISSTDTNTTYSAGTGLSLVGTTFNNTEPDQTVTLTGSGATSVSGTYPNFTISSTDTNTTYSAGNGISLSGTTFSVAAGGGLTQDASGLSHTDTSTQASVDNSNGTVIQDVTLDTYGHVTALGSVDLDGRYYTEAEIDTKLTNGTVTTIANAWSNTAGNMQGYVNDGGGNLGIRFNATSGGTNTLVENGQAYEIQVNNDINGGDFVFYHGTTASGTAGDTITWSESMRIEGTTNNIHVANDLNVGANVVATGDVTAYSDERLKENIETITDAVSKVDQLRGVTYVRKSDGIASTGVIAQDVEKVLPQAVATDEDGMMSVKYGNMVGLLIEAIKEQNETIKGMQAEIAELKARLNS